MGHTAQRSELRLVARSLYQGTLVEMRLPASTKNIAFGLRLIIETLVCVCTQGESDMKDITLQ